MSKWNKRYLIKLSPDKVINESATTYRKYYSLPPSDRFVDESSKADSGWTTLSSGSLSAITLQDKLFIVAHGSPTHVAEYTARSLADSLAGWGLDEVGLITFKCCHVGRDTFLEDFVKYAGRVSGIKIGWVKGYRGAAQTWLGGPLKPIERIKNVNSGGFKSGESRFKVVAGLEKISIAGSRYELPADDDDD
jgi:hypothetical protein